MADTTTSILSLTKPEVNVEDPATDWGDKLNDNFDDIDTRWTSTTPSTQAFGDAASAGSSLNVARADHKHAMPSGGTLTGTLTFSAAAALVLTTPDGAHTYKLSISNEGELQTEQLT